MESTHDKARHYDIHGAVSISLVGRGPASDIIDRTLQYFESAESRPDLKLVLGEYPGEDWRPTGTSVGDRTLFDEGTGTTSVLRSRVVSDPARQEVEFVVVGDLRSYGTQVVVYVPKMDEPIAPRGAFIQNLKQRRGRAALLALAGNPLGMRRVVRQAEKITEAVIEPFLYHRLPHRGFTLAHAASTCSEGSATVLAGTGNVGKSSLALRFAKAGMGFQGDALVILSESGDVLAYPGLMKLHKGHLSALPELRERLTRGMGPSEAWLFKSELSSRPAEALSALPQPKLCELIEGATLVPRSKIANVILLERGASGETGLKETDPGEAARTLSAELYWAFEVAPWRNAQFIYAPSAARGQDFLDGTRELHSRIDEIMRRGVSGARCRRVTLPFAASIDSVEESVKGIWGQEKN